MSILLALLLNTAWAPRARAPVQIGRYAVRWIPADFEPEGGVGLNERGEVVTALDGRVFVWKADKQRLVAGITAHHGFAIPYAINNAGWIVGSFRETYSGAISYHQDEGFIWNGRTIRRMNEDGSGLPLTIVKAVNEKSQYAGSTVQFVPSGYGPSWTDDASWRGVKNGINRLGFTVGLLEVAEDGGISHSRAVIWSGKHRKRLRDFGGFSSVANAVNDSGCIVGETTLSTWADRAVRWVDRIPQLLTSLPRRKHSTAFDINAKGVIVGAAWNKPDEWEDGLFKRDADHHACIWIRGKVFDMNRLATVSRDDVLEEARAINSSGMVAGYGVHSGQRMVFVLVPLDRSE